MCFADFGAQIFFDRKDKREIKGMVKITLPRPGMLFLHIICKCCIIINTPKIKGGVR